MLAAAVRRVLAYLTIILLHSCVYLSKIYGLKVCWEADLTDGIQTCQAYDAL